MTLDKDNNYLYIADSSNSRVLIHDVSSSFNNGQDALFVLGQPDFVSYSPGTAINSMYSPDDVVFDSKSDLLYIGDGYKHRVLAFDVSDIDNGEDAMGVIGQPDFNSSASNQGNALPDSYTVDFPFGFGINSETGELLVGDHSNNRVLQYKFGSLSQSTLSSGESGEAYSQNLTVVNDQGTPTISLDSGTLPPGLTLNASSITGTPTTTGVYTFTLLVEDDNGTNGVFRQRQEYEIVIDPELIDTDEDGITDVIENAGPNNGDANNDTILDSEQTNVTTFINNVTNNYVTLASSCTTISQVTVEEEGNQDSLDSAFTYPLGLLNFTLLCDTPGATATVTQYFYEDLDSTLLTPRKYKPSIQDYFTITDAQITSYTIGAEDVIIVTFDITDGGELDTDGIENSVIIDPSGLALNSVDSPDTGLGGSYVKD